MRVSEAFIPAVRSERVHDRRSSRREGMTRITQWLRTTMGERTECGLLRDQNLDRIRLLSVSDWERGPWGVPKIVDPLLQCHGSAPRTLQ